MTTGTSSSAGERAAGGDQRADRRPSSRLGAAPPRSGCSQPRRPTPAPSRARAGPSLRPSRAPAHPVVLSRPRRIGAVPLPASSCASRRWRASCSSCSSMSPRNSSTSASARRGGGHPGRDRLDRGRHRLERQRRLRLGAGGGRRGLRDLHRRRRVGRLTHVRARRLRRWCRAARGRAAPSGRLAGAYSRPGVERLERAHATWPSRPAAASSFQPRPSAASGTSSRQRDVAVRPRERPGRERPEGRARDHPTAERAGPRRIGRLEDLAVPTFGVGQPAGFALDVELRKLERLLFGEDWQRDAPSLSRLARRSSPRRRPALPRVGVLGVGPDHVVHPGLLGG